MKQDAKLKAGSRKSAPAKTSILKTFFENSPGNTAILVGVTVLVVLASCLWYLMQAYDANGYFSFPLDDAWIHLTFAKNIHDFGAFSYFKHEQLTSGSTSPLYTGILACLFFVSQNEFFISFLCGIGFACVAIAITYFLSHREFRANHLFAFILAILIAVQPKLQFIAVSGMETTLFIALLLLAAYFYRSQKGIELGVALGLLVWARPDGFIFWIAIIIDFIWHRFLVKEPPAALFNTKRLFYAFCIAAVFSVSYFGFNEWLSGTMLPNSWRSKVMLYQENSRLLFLQREVWGLLTSNEFLLLWIFFVAAGFFIIVDIARRKANSFFLYLLFITGLITSYTIFVPFAHLYTRYLLPVIPFFILVSGYGLLRLVALIPRLQNSPDRVNLVLPGIALVFVLQAILSMNSSMEQYQTSCKYYHDRHVVTAEWIAANTPENAIIGVHDIGAIGFYGHRKLFDMAGLCTPEMMNVGLLNNTNALNALLEKNKISYLVVLSSWLEVSGAQLLFMPEKNPEEIYVYKYLPGKTRILTDETLNFLHLGADAANAGNYSEAENYLRRACNSDTLSAKSYYLTAYFYYYSNQNDSALKFVQKSLSRYPEDPEANFLLAKLLDRTGQSEKALAILDKCIPLLLDKQVAFDMKKELQTKLKLN
jgi:hypothetical protein